MEAAICYSMQAFDVCINVIPKGEQVEIVLTTFSQVVTAIWTSDKDTCYIHNIVQ